MPPNPGSATVSPVMLAPNRDGARTAVYRYDEGASPAFTLLPNVRCVSISRREGTPGSARFRYVFDQTASDAFPRAFEDVFPLDAAGPYVVATDDRLCVGMEMPDGSLKLLFDGFTQMPECDYSRQGEQVTFQALGTPFREWDEPLGGAVYRDADDPAALVDVITDLPARFNPDGRPNATEDGDDSEDPDDPTVTSPVFLDERTCAPAPEGGFAIGRTWTLGMAVRYCIARGNRFQTYIRNLGFDAIDDALMAVVPAEGFDAIDWDEPDSYDLESIVAPDLDVTGMAWPEAVRRLVEPHGFGFDFRLQVQSGEPYWTFRLYRKDAPLRLKRPKLQPQGSAFRAALTEVSSLKLTRDTTDLTNRIEVDAGTRLVEASFVLAPAGEVASVDADADNLHKWVAGDPGYEPGYRTWILNEAGVESHWDFVADATSDDAPDLAIAFGQAEDVSDAERNHVRRRRPGLNRLISTDADGNPLRAQLWAAKLADYSGPVPGLWDGDDAVQWQLVPSGWKLLDDRLGIELTVKDLESLSLEKGTDDDRPFPADKLRVVYATAKPDTAKTGRDADVNARFVFRLTCVVETDQGLDAIAERRASSPVSYEITRRVDGRDRFRRQTISRRSHLSAGTTADVDARNDTEAARSYARAVRAASEMARLAGTLTIPRVTLAYDVGDQIELIAGRDASLSSAAGGAAGESPRYPSVVGLEWTLDGEQGTTLMLSDHRGEAQIPS